MVAPLAERLAALDADFRLRLVDYTLAMDRLFARLGQNGAGSTAPKVGDRFPDFVLPDSKGNLWHLDDALTKGPIVIAFHRGYWCDFCHLNMASIAQIGQQLADMGSQIIAISPENAENANNLAQEEGAKFSMLCDIGLGVSTMLGLTYAVDNDLKHELALLEVDLDAGNCGEGWLLPITATFVIDSTGLVVARHLDPDPRNRMDSDAILQAAATCQSAARS
jgi:peroxiredoxin